MAFTLVGRCLFFCLIYTVVKQRYPRWAVCCIALTLLRCRFSLRRPPPRIARPTPLGALSRGSWDQGLKKYFICLDFHFTILGSHWSVEHLRKARRDHMGRCCHWIEYDTEYKLVIKIFPMSWRDTQFISIINLLRPLWVNLSKTLDILRLGIYFWTPTWLNWLNHQLDSSWTFGICFCVERVHWRDGVFHNTINKDCIFSGVSEDIKLITWDRVMFTIENF